MSDFHFEIVEEIGVLSSNPKTGWSKEVTRVSWNGAPAKLDIRDWSPDHSKMGKGVSFNAEEQAKLKEIMSQL